MIFLIFSFWSHAEFNSPHKDLYLRDGVHVNPTGQYFLYRSYRGAVLKALGLLGGIGFYIIARPRIRQFLFSLNVELFWLSVCGYASP